MDKSPRGKTKNKKSTGKPKTPKKRKSDGPTCSMFLAELTRKLASKKKQQEESSKSIVQTIIDSITNALPIKFLKRKAEIKELPVESESPQNNALPLLLSDTVEETKLEIKSNYDNDGDYQMLNLEDTIRKTSFKVPKMPVINSEDFKIAAKRSKRAVKEDAAVNTGNGNDVAIELAKHVNTLKKISLIAEEFNKKTGADDNLKPSHIPRYIKSSIKAVSQPRKLFIDPSLEKTKLLAKKQETQIKSGSAIKTKQVPGQALFNVDMGSDRLNEWLMEPVANYLKPPVNFLAPNIPSTIVPQISHSQNCVNKNVAIDENQLRTMSDQNKVSDFAVGFEKTNMSPICPSNNVKNGSILEQESPVNNTVPGCPLLDPRNESIKFQTSDDFVTINQLFECRRHKTKDILKRMAPCRNAKGELKEIKKHTAGCKEKVLNERKYISEKTRRYFVKKGTQKETKTDKIPAPSYVEYSSEILQRMTNLEAEGYKTIRSINETDIEVRDDYSSNYFMEHGVSSLIDGHSVDCIHLDSCKDSLTCAQKNALLNKCPLKLNSSERNYKKHSKVTTLQDLQRFIFSENDDLQAALLLYHEAGSDAAAKEQKSAEIANSLKLSSDVYSKIESGTLYKGNKLHTKQANVGPSMFLFAENMRHKTLANKKYSGKPIVPLVNSNGLKIFNSNISTSVMKNKSTKEKGNEKSTNLTATDSILRSLTADNATGTEASLTLISKKDSSLLSTSSNIPLTTTSNAQEGYNQTEEVASAEIGTILNSVSTTELEEAFAIAKDISTEITEIASREVNLERETSRYICCRQYETYSHGTETGSSILGHRQATSTEDLEHYTDVGVSTGDLIKQYSFNGGSHHSKCSVTADVHPEQANVSTSVTGQLKTKSFGAMSTQRNRTQRTVTIYKKKLDTYIQNDCRRELYGKIAHISPYQ
ncbi:unnamed protein product [Parnassius apollo]|uniref:(apollo) hypothetical protein n=1 Tax=Parnassius apollo TaxID=110799 RepID=A0A8S3YGJ6_PARAO|nr:unnamed protein product [Parnassius apollo]